MVAVFRASEYATRLNEGRPANKQVVVGRRQLAKAKCKCIKKRKASVTATASHAPTMGGLRFEGSQGGPQGRTLRNQATNGGLSFLGRDAQNLILAACDDD